MVHASARKPTNVTLDAGLLREAASEIAKARADVWLRENAEAIAASSAYVDANGLPLATLRRF